MAFEGDLKAVKIPLMPRSWWARDPTMAKYVRGLFGKMPITEMPAAVAAKFNRAAPSKSAIVRYMNHLRGGSFKGLKRPK